MPQTDFRELQGRRLHVAFKVIRPSTNTPRKFLSDREVPQENSSPRKPQRHQRASGTQDRYSHDMQDPSFRPLRQRREHASSINEPTSSTAVAGTSKAASSGGSPEGFVPVHKAHLNQPPQDEMADRRSLPRQHVAQGLDSDKAEQMRSPTESREETVQKLQPCVEGPLQSEQAHVTESGDISVPLGEDPPESSSARRQSNKKAASQKDIDQLTQDEASDRKETVSGDSPVVETNVAPTSHISQEQVPEKAAQVSRTRAHQVRIGGVPEQPESFLQESSLEGDPVPYPGAQAQHCEQSKASKPHAKTPAMAADAPEPGGKEYKSSVETSKNFEDQAVATNDPTRSARRTPKVTQVPTNNSNESSLQTSKTKGPSSHSTRASSSHMENVASQIAPKRPALSIKTDRQSVRPQPVIPDLSKTSQAALEARSSEATPSAVTPKTASTPPTSQLPTERPNSRADDDTKIEPEKSTAESKPPSTKKASESGPLAETTKGPRSVETKNNPASRSHGSTTGLPTDSKQGIKANGDRSDAKAFTKSNEHHSNTNTSDYKASGSKGKSVHDDTVTQAGQQVRVPHMEHGEDPDEHEPSKIPQKTDFLPQSVTPGPIVTRKKKQKRIQPSKENNLTDNNYYSNLPVDKEESEAAASDVIVSGEEEKLDDVEAGLATDTKESEAALSKSAASDELKQVANVSFAFFFIASECPCTIAGDELIVR